MREKWLIDPKKSAKENLWDACQVATYFFRQKYAAKLKLSKAEWEELNNNVVLAAVKQFMDQRIRNHQYCHETSFYFNCFACVMSVWSGEVRKLLNSIKKSMDNIDKLEPEKRRAAIDTARPVFYLNTGSGNSYGSTKNLQAWMNRSCNETFCAHEDEEDFWSYLESCLDLGIPVDENAPLFKRGRWIKY